MAGVIIIAGFKVPDSFIEAWYKHYHGVPAMMKSKEKKPMEKKKPPMPHKGKKKPMKDGY